MPVRKPKDPDRSPDLPHDWISRQIARVAPCRFEHTLPINDWQFKRAQYIAFGEYEFIDTEWQPIQPGEVWGGNDVTVFFETEFDFPISFIGSDTYLDIDMDGGETQLSINGYPWQGLDFSRSLAPLAEHARQPGKIKLEPSLLIFLMTIGATMKRNSISSSALNW